MPRKRKEPVAAVCADCGVTFTTGRSDARFCCPAHQLAFGNRMASRGKVLAPYVLAWIAGRGGGHAGTHPVAGPAMREITAIARGFIDEDKEAGRPSAIGYVESLLAEGLYIDRKAPNRRRAAAKAP
jgi:hypothetical protein